MIRTVEAIIDEQGTVLLQEAVALTGPRRVLVTILEEEPYSNGTALLSEAALAEDWHRPEENAAWSHLQPVSSTGEADTAADPLVTRPRRPREGWEEHFKQIAAVGEDRLLDAASLTPTQWDKEEWEW